MPFPERLLGEGEYVELELRPHWRRAVGPVLTLLALTLGGGLLLGLVPTGTYQDEGQLVVVAAALAGIALWVLRPLLRWRSTSYVLTNRRLIVRSGILARSRRDLSLARVSDMALVQRGLLDRVLRSGSLVVDAAGEGGRVDLRDVPTVAEVHRLVYELAEAEEQRRRWHPPAPSW